MSNANRPGGLSPVGYLNGAPWNGKARVYCIPSTDNNAYGIGDPLVLAGSADASGVPTVTLATAGATNSVLGPYLGVTGVGTNFQGYGSAAADPVNNGRVIIPATKTQAYYVEVADDPNTIFEIQEDSVGNNIAVTGVGLNYDLVSGVNNGYVSGWMLDSSTGGAGATLQFKPLQAVQRVDNALGTYCKWSGIINLHCYRIGQVGY